MRVLLDESLPGAPKRELDDFQAATVPEAGWAGTKNGALLKLANEEFDVFVTPDRSMPFQQNLSGLRLSLIILLARSNDIADLLPLVPGLKRALLGVKPGDVLRLGA